ncbi:MAG: DNA internalization-related competence protein ComEC/Rec2 [Lachnospiraceae bacterium]|nr:DNA internalization-related competence protein ComEC/Rec2 [Lachnospiraceae bacterium]
MARRPLCLLCLIALILLAVYGFISGGGGTADDAGIRSILSETPRAVVLGCVERSKIREADTVCVLSRASLVHHSETVPIGKIKLYLEAGERYPAGYILSAEGILTETAGPENPGEYDARFYARLEDTVFRMRNPDIRVLKKEKDVFREGISNMGDAVSRRIAQVFPEDVSGICAAMLTGDRSGLPDETGSLWKSGGIMHMIAISGLHLSVLGMGLFRLLSRICFFCASLSARLLPRRRRRRGRRWRTGRVPLFLSGILSLALMLFYTVFTGMSVSTVRAFLMFGLLIGARLSGRTYDPPTALALAALLIAMENPLSIRAPGFLLSFGAAAAFMVFRDRGGVMKLLLLTLWMLPLTLWFFGELPLFSIPVNLIAVPLLPVILLSGMAGLVLPAASLPAVFLIRALNALLAALGRIPCAVFITGRPRPAQIAVYLLFLAGWTCVSGRWSHFKRRFLLLPLLPLLVLVLPRQLPSDLVRLAGGRTKLTVTVLSVGQGDSVFLRLPDGTSILTDGGSTTKKEVGKYRILPYLNFEGTGRLDYVIVTHMDKDHVSGILELLDMTESGISHVRIGTLFLPYMRTEDEQYRGLAARAERLGIRVLTLRKGDRIDFGGTVLRVLNPDPDLEGTPPDLNAQCVAYALHFGAFDALFTGDISGPGEAQMVSGFSDRYENAADYELLKVAHHGSGYSTPAEFLSAVRPDLSVISCGAGNRYGHPHADLTGRLSDCGSEIARTDLSGAVTVVTDGESWSMRTFRGPGAGMRGSCH